MFLSALSAAAFRSSPSRTKKTTTTTTTTSGARSFGGLLYDALMIHVQEEDHKKKLALPSGAFFATADAADTTIAFAAS